MDFIIQHDWLHRGSEKEDFLTEEAIKRSNLNKIISGTFRDPLVSDEDSDQDRNNDIDSLIKNKNMKNNKNKGSKKDYIPGLRTLPFFPRQSTLSIDQHTRGVRLLAQNDRTISCTHNNYKATQIDRDTFKKMEADYKKEEREFREWARTQWIEKICIRALRPLPVFERMYEGDRSARVAMMASLPLRYEYAAQIRMCSGEKCVLERVEDLKKVDMSELPLLQIPPMDKLQSVAFSLEDMYIPRPCKKHPSRVVLPDENRISSLPLRELHTELAKYAASQNAKCIVSEKALRTLVHTSAEWILPVNVESVTVGESSSKIVVIDEQVHPNREYTRARTAKALNLLLRHYLTRNSESHHEEAPESHEIAEIVIETKDDSDAESDMSDDDKLFIDMNDSEVRMDVKPPSDVEDKTTKVIEKRIEQTEKEKLRNIGSQILDTQCSCKGTPSERPPHISYKKWLSKNNSESIPIIVYTSHKCKNESGHEVIVNAIPEYQIELGASAVNAGALRSLAIALTLRENCQLLSARIDATNGHIVTIQYSDKSNLCELGDEAATRDLTQEGVDMLHATLSQLCMLKENRYVLSHQAQHNENALLFVASNHILPNIHSVSLQVDDTYKEDKERSDLQIPPTLSRALLPAHKLRRLLPLAFGPYPPKKKPKPTKQEKKKAVANEIKKKKRARKRAARKSRKKANK